MIVKEKNGGFLDLRICDNLELMAEIKDNTTVKEIEEFYRKHIKVGIMEVRLSGLEVVPACS